MLYRVGRNWAVPETMGQLAYYGFEYGETPVDVGFIPSQDDAAWAIQKEKLKEAEEKFGLKFETANGFLPGRLHICGENPDTEELLRYAETACRRADEIGTKFIVFGSGGARQVPEGFDYARGMAQFIDFCREMVRRIADCNVTVVFENLQAKECNVLNLLSQEQEIVELIDSPKLQMMADFFHMVQMNEPPEAIIKAGAHLKHVHIADPKTRLWPGNTDGDLSKYFSALKQINYNGCVTFECSWPDVEKVGLDGVKEAVEQSFAVVNSWMENT